MSDQAPILAELRAEGILRHIPAHDLEALKYYGVFGEYAVGENVILEGAMQNRLYIVIAGKMHVITATSGTEVFLGEILQGDCFGEMSVFEPGPASATVRVMEASVLWSIDVPSLESFFQQLPAAGGQLMLGVAQLLTRRLRLANQTILANRMLPRHLSVRSGKHSAISATTLETEEEKGGLFGIFGKKTTTIKIRGDVKL